MSVIDPRPDPPVVVPARLVNSDTREVSDGGDTREASGKSVPISGSARTLCGDY